MDTELRSNLLAAINTLEKVEVKGKDNLSALLGTINHLEKIVNGGFGDYQKVQSELDSE